MTKTEAINTSRRSHGPRAGHPCKQRPSVLRGCCGAFVILSTVAGLLGGTFIVAWQAKEKPDVVVREAVSPEAMTPRGSTPQVFEFKLDKFWEDSKRREIESLRLFEESATLRLAAESGAVQASEWGVYAQNGHVVAFTTSDGSDPRTNARSYSVSYLARASHPYLLSAAIVFLSASVLLAFGGVVAAIRGRRRRVDRPEFPKTAAVLLLTPLFLPSLFIVNQIYHIYPDAVVRGLDVVEPGAVQFDHPAINRFGYLYPFTKAPEYSDVRIFEGGSRLGPSTGTLYRNLLERGQGRYRLYKGRLYFSSSDGTDPRENGRIYTLSYPAFVSNPWVNVAGTTLFLASVVLLGAIGWQRMHRVEAPGPTRALAAYAFLAVTLCALHLFLIDENAATRLGPNLLLATLLPLPGLRLGSTVGRTLSVLVVFTAYFGILMAKWQQGTSDGLMLGGLFPWSDGNGYLQGAFQALNGETIDPLSSRRPIHPLALGLLLAVTGSDIQLAIVLQTLFVAVGVVFLGWILVRRSTILVAFFTLLAILLFYPRFVGTTWTENSGILWGCLATGFLIESAYDRRWLLGVVSIVLLSWALNARAGAMFVLPLACVWLAWEHGVAWRTRAHRLAVYIVAAAVPFVVTSVIVAEFGTKSAALFANFPVSLYGTLTGGGWRSAQSEPRFAGLEDRELAVALMQTIKETIIEDPTTLLRGIKHAYSQFRPWIFVGSDSLRWTLNLLSVIGVVASLFTFRRNVFSRFLTVGATGILLSVPFAPPWDADGMRAYAATLPVSGALVGWGVTVLFSTVRTKIKNRRTGSGLHIDTPTPDGLRPATILAPVIAAGVIALIPLLYKTVLGREPIVNRGPDQRVVTFMPLQGSTLHIISDGTGKRSLRPLEIEEGRFDRELAVIEGSYPEAGRMLRRISRPGISLSWGEGFNPIIMPSERLGKSAGKRVVVNGAVVVLPWAPRFFVEESLLDKADDPGPIR